MALLQQKRTAETCRKVLWFCGMFLSWRAHLTMGQLVNRNLHVLPCPRMEKTPFFFFFIFHCYFLVEYLSTVNTTFPVGWAEPGADCTDSFFPREDSQKAAPDTALSRLGWVLSRGPLQPELWFCIREHKFWMNSAWQLSFCWHRYEDVVTV